jgi:flagellar hook-length control protein FliK
MEQNGMKLASFSVGSQSSNDQQRQFANQNKDRNIGKVSRRGNKDLIASDMLKNSKDEPSGLNLIA